jgi:hypothetical protein
MAGAGDDFALLAGGSGDSGTVEAELSAASPEIGTAAVAARSLAAAPRENVLRIHAVQSG